MNWHIYSIFFASLILLVLSQVKAEPFKYEASVNTIVQTSDLEQDDLTVSADVFASYQVKQFILNAHLEAASTPRDDGLNSRLEAANADAGSALNQDGKGRVQLSEVYLSWLPDKKSVGLHLGLINVGNWLDTSLTANDENQQFILADLVNNPVIDFPDYALGLVYEQQLLAQLKASLVLSDSEGLADSQQRSYSQLFETGDDEAGNFIAAQLHYEFKASNQSQNGIQLGIWKHTAAHENLQNPQDNQLSNYGFYTVLSHALNDQQALDFRVGYTNPKVSRVSQFYALSYQQASSLFVPASQLGVGISYSVSEMLVDEVKPATDHYAAEIYYRMPVWKNLELTPSIQLFDSPVTNDVTLKHQQVWVGSLRAYIYF